MKNKLLKILYILLLLVPLFLNLFKNNTYSSSVEDVKTLTYFTGIGCPHCSKISPFLHDKIDSSEGLVLIEYEIYSENENASLIYKYNDTYDIGLGIPVITNGVSTFSGDSPIRNNFSQLLDSTEINSTLLEGTVVDINKLNLNDVNGTPKIYANNRVVIKKHSCNLTQQQNDTIISFLTTDLEEWINLEQTVTQVQPQIVEYPGGQLKYQNAVKVGDYLLQWNGGSIENITSEQNISCPEDEITIEKSDISFTSILGLALADSINPCAISILLLMLLAITTYNPKDRKQILFSGLAFIAAVIVMYMIYGFLIIKAFQFIQSITVLKTALYNSLAIIAFVLGILEIKDFIKYKPGSVGTEMPLFLRPKMQKIVSKITSPAGAFGLGLFVTLFLLPCTIGPYVILAGMLSTTDFLTSSPYLLLYNTIFVLPMLAVTLIIFFGTKKIKDISDWKNKNVRYMHLISGILMCILAIVMFFGLL